MKKLMIGILTATVIAMSAGMALAQKSALDNVQFDGVESDQGLKTAGLTREKWLALYPVQAKEYWDAWDCKGQPCDSQWKANIRAKAKLVLRAKKAATKAPAGHKAK